MTECLPVVLFQGFFRRTLKKQLKYKPCKGGIKCNIDTGNRNKCQYCRYQRCINAGMSPDGKIFMYYQGFPSPGFWQKWDPFPRFKNNIFPKYFGMNNHSPDSECSRLNA